MKRTLRKDNGVTLVALVVTIIVLIILAGVSINLILGDNGIVTIAKKSKENIELAKIEEETELNELYMQLENNEENAENVGLGDLKAELAQTNATADKILKDYKAYSKGKLLTGTIEDYSGQIVTADTIIENGDNVEIKIPLNGYYETDSKISIPIETIKKDVGSIGSFGKVIKNVTFNSTKITSENVYKASISDLYDNYKNITKENFFFEYVSCSQQYYGVTRSKISYDANTGTITATDMALWGSTVVLDICIVE